MTDMVVLGTGNRDKARELRAILAGLPYDIRGLKEFDAVRNTITDRLVTDRTEQFAVDTTENLDSRYRLTVCTSTPHE